MALPAIALPGQYLGPSSQYAPGPGTHIHDNHIYASIAGPVSTKAPAPSKPKPDAKSRSSQPSPPLLTISRPSQSPTATLSPSTLGLLGPSAGGGTTILPEVESVVLARITRLGPRFATCDILVVGDVVCREGFHGLVRREDIRATEKDKIKVEECFRVGDLIRGMVISLGDQSHYYISTAMNEYGVVMARSREGNDMFPVSWREMRDRVTGRREGRKVARPF